MSFFLCIIITPSHKHQNAALCTPVSNRTWNEGESQTFHQICPDSYSKCCLVLRSCLPCSVKYLKHLFRARDSHIETCLLLIHHSNVYNSLTTQPDEEACRHSQETRTGAVKQLSCHCCFLGCTSAGNQNQLEVTLEPIHSNMGCECPNCFLTQTLPKPTLFSTLSMDIKLQNVITCCYCS